MKKRYTYTIEKAVEKSLDEHAAKIYRSKSSIVQEAIQQWLKNRKPNNK
jgi:predicted transcriptional regulator